MAPAALAADVRLAPCLTEEGRKEHLVHLHERGADISQHVHRARHVDHNSVGQADTLENRAHLVGGRQDLGGGEDKWSAAGGVRERAARHANRDRQAKHADVRLRSRQSPGPV